MDLDRNFIISTSEEESVDNKKIPNPIWLWELSSGKKLSQFSGHEDLIEDFYVPKNRNEFLSISLDEHILRWDYE